MIHITPAAISELSALLTKQNAPEGSGLRISVEKGGCAGWQYAMRVAQPELGDQVFNEGGVSLIIDSASLTFLYGSTLDFEDALNDSGFRVINPNATRSCGCGTSFEPKEQA